MTSANTGQGSAVRLAIVGTRILACRGDRDRARARAAAAISKLAPGLVISGGAAGADQLAALAAAELGYSEEAGTLLIFRPRVHRLHGPGGYRERDKQIAQACTHLLRISCRQATTYGSGWTADRAAQLGAIVVQYDVCSDRSFRHGRQPSPPPASTPPRLPRPLAPAVVAVHRKTQLGPVRLPVTQLSTRLGTYSTAATASDPRGQDGEKPGICDRACPGAVVA